MPPIRKKRKEKTSTERKEGGESPGVVWGTSKNLRGGKTRNKKKG